MQVVSVESQAELRECAFSAQGGPLTLRSKSRCHHSDCFAWGMFEHRPVCPLANVLQSFCTAPEVARSCCLFKRAAMGLICTGMELCCIMLLLVQLFCVVGIDSVLLWAVLPSHLTSQRASDPMLSILMVVWGLTAWPPMLCAAL